MATVTRRCKNDRCKRRFRISAQSRRLFCEECRPSRAKSSDVDETTAPPAAGPGPIEAQSLARLEGAGRIDTIEGQLLLRLAREADDGRATASQLASLSEKLLRVADAALAGTKTREPDRLDELTARRLAKVAAAS